MSQIQKLIRRFLSRPTDFSWDELSRLLSHFGYSEKKTGKTAGSARVFVREMSKSIIRIHKPHPGSILKMYVIDLIREELRKQGLL